MPCTEGMNGKTKFRTESFIQGERVTSHNLLSAPVVFPFIKTIISSSSAIFDQCELTIAAPSRIRFVNETVFSRTEMIFHAAVTIFSVLENIVVETEMTLCGTRTIGSGSLKIVVIFEKIIFKTNKIFFVSEKIFSETLPDSRNQRVASLAVEKIFSAIEKIFLRTEMILSRAKKVFCRTKKIIFVRGPIPLWFEEGLARNEVPFLPHRSNPFCRGEGHFRDDDTFLRDGEDLLRPGQEFLCGRNDVLCRRENRRRGAGGSVSKPSTNQHSPDFAFWRRSGQVLGFKTQSDCDCR